MKTNPSLPSLEGTPVATATDVREVAERAHFAARAFYDQGDLTVATRRGATGARLFALATALDALTSPAVREAYNRAERMVAKQREWLAIPGSHHAPDNVKNVNAVGALVDAIRPFLTPYTSKPQDSNLCRHCGNTYYTPQCESCYPSPTTSES